MSVTASATLTNDISYALSQNGLNRYSESASLGYSYSFSDGIGSGNIDYGVMITGSLVSGAKTSFDLTALNKEVFNSVATIDFDRVKAIVVQNRSLGSGQDINIHATGSTALTELFNGGSGNLLIKPFSAYQYADPIAGATIDSGNNSFTLQDVGGSGINWSLIVIGVTGTGA